MQHNNCGFGKFIDIQNTQEKPKLEKKASIIITKQRLNTVYFGTYEIYLEKLTQNSPRSRNSSPLLPNQYSTDFGEVMLQSFNNGTTIRVINIPDNNIDINHLYSDYDLKHMQCKIIDPEEPNYAADCIVYAYEYINFLKELNIKFPYHDLFILYGAPELENAYWNGYYLTFGNGKLEQSYPFVSRSIVAHELTHALIQSSINLQYKVESGALNESYCDIFAVMLEDYIERKRGIGFELGSELFIDNHSLRSFIEPNRCGQPSSIRDPLFYRGSDDNGGVHINSGVINHLFYRMSLVTNKKLVFDLFLKVFFKLAMKSTFNDFRRILLSYCISNISYVNVINEILTFC